MCRNLTTDGIFELANVEGNELNTSDFKQPYHQKSIRVRLREHGGHAIVQSHLISQSSPKIFNKNHFTVLALCGGAPSCIKVIEDNTFF